MKVLWFSLILTGLACIGLPYSGLLAVAVTLFFIMGAGRHIPGLGPFGPKDLPRRR